MKSEIAFVWDIPKGDSRAARLHQKLFGQKVVRKLANGKTKTHYYNGVLAAWEHGERVNVAHYVILGDSIFAIPDMEEKFVPEILHKFEELKLSVRRLRLVENEYYTWQGIRERG